MNDKRANDAIIYCLFLRCKQRNRDYVSARINDWLFWWCLISTVFNFKNYEILKPLRCKGFRAIAQSDLGYQSELSGGQTRNPCGAVVSSVLHKIEQRLRENLEPLQHNGSRSFQAVFKIVVKQQSAILLRAESIHSPRKTFIAAASAFGAYFVSCFSITFRDSIGST